MNHAPTRWTVSLSRLPNKEQGHNYKGGRRQWVTVRGWFPVSSNDLFSNWRTPAIPAAPSWQCCYTSYLYKCFVQRDVRDASPCAEAGPHSRNSPQVTGQSVDITNKKTAPIYRYVYVSTSVGPGAQCEHQDLQKEHVKTSVVLHMRRWLCSLHRSRASFLEMWGCWPDSCRSPQNEDRACVSPLLDCMGG
jgi:hypothetical protein